MEELRRADHILENILQGITDSVLLLSKDLKILWANKAFQDQTGYTIEEVIGNYCYKLTHHRESPCQLPHDLCPASESENIGGTATTIHTHFDKEGNKIFVEASAYPVKDEKGEITQFVCVYRDITETKRVEERLLNALSESIKRQTEISALLEGTSAVLESHTFNDAARSIFNSCKNIIGAAAGYIALVSKDGTQNEVAYLDSGSLPCTVDPNLPMPIRGLREIGIRTGKTVYHNDFSSSEFVKFIPEGHANLQNVLFAPLAIKGRVVGLLGLSNKPGGFTDDDVRIASGFGELAAIALLNKRAEEILSISIREWHATFDAVEDPVFLTGMKGEILRCNVAMAHYIGKSFKEIIGHTYKELMHHKAEHVEKSIMRMQETRKRNTMIAQTEDRWLNITVDPMFDKAKNLIGGVCILSDITELKRAEEAIRESEERLSLVANGLPALIAYVDSDQTYRFVNKEYENWFGRSPSEIVGQKVRDVLGKADYEKIREKIEAVLSGESVSYEDVLQLRDGSTHHYYAQYLPHKTRYGSIPGYFLMVVDITDRKRVEEALRQARDELEVRVQERTAELMKVNELLRAEIAERKRVEEALRESETKHRIVADNTYDWEWWVSPKGQFIYVSPSCKQITGFEPEEFLKDPDFLVRIIHPDDRSTFVRHYSEAEQKLMPGEVEFRIIRADGSCRWLAHVCQPVFDNEGHFLGRRGSNRDITKRKQAEKALRRSEASLSEAQRIASLGNWNWNIQTNDLRWSDEIYRIFGLTPQQFEATYEAFLNCVHPDDGEFVKKAVHEALYERKPYSIDHRIVLPDGSVRTVHEQAKVIFDDAGNPVFMNGTVQDITEHKRAEEELKNSREELRNLSAYLQSLREEERTRIAREIHDELGQALTALKMDIFWLSSQLPKTQKPLIEKGKSISKLIDTTIKAVRRISAELRPEILDHLGLTAAVEWQVEEFKNRSGIKCDVSIEPEEITLNRDLSTSVFRILQETLTNVARHAMATKVRVDLKEKEGTLVLKVSDNGKGITKKQTSDTQSLGLIGIRERARHWGGEVEIKGIRNKGTRVTVFIPLKKEGERP